MSFYKEVKLFMIFDILGDIERTGHLLWKINRKRLEDVKNHILDLLLMVRILKQHLPTELDFEKINDYIICHDLPEAITGDITKFEGITDEEKERVTSIAIQYLSKEFEDVMDFSTILNNYEGRVDLEAKVVCMFDKLHSATTFIKYQSEQNIDMDAPGIISSLRNHPFVVRKIAEGKDLADIFFEFHMKAIKFTAEEIKQYGITIEIANRIVDVITGFANEIYSKKQNGPWTMVKQEFPNSAMKYNRNKMA